LANLDWRCAAAQTFVDGQITQVDAYWQSNVLGAKIYELIDQHSLWQDAFGPDGTKVKDKWRTMLAFRQVTSAGDLKRRVLGNLAGKNEFKLGSELFGILKTAVVMPLQRMHNRSSLTINFRAGGWFSQQAGFAEYTTMWDRKTTGQVLTTTADIKNPAEVRAKADRWALYGQFDDALPGKELAGKQLAAAAGLQLPHVKKTTDPKTYKPSWDYSSSKSQPSASNPADNQVYAALNYGCRQHGSSTRYGKSFFELSDEYKKEAIYIAMDSFTAVYAGLGGAAIPKAQRTKLYQVSAGSFGGAILLAIQSQDQGSPNTKRLLIELLSCARSPSPRADTDEEHLLIEAHIFRKVKMNSHCIKSVGVSAGECGPIEKANATKFGRQYGIPVTFIP